MSRASELMDSRKFMAAMDRLIEEWQVNDDGSSVSDDEAKAGALQAVLDMAAGGKWSPPEVGYAIPEAILEKTQAVLKPRGIKALIPVPEPRPIVNLDLKMRAAEASLKPKRKRRTKAEMEAAKLEAPKSKAEARKAFLAEAEKITPEQRARFKAEDEKNRPPDQVGVLRKTICEVIKPAWAHAGRNSMDGYRTFNVKAVRNNQPLSMYHMNWADALRAEGLPVSFDGQAPKITFRPLNISQNGDSSGDGKQELWIEVKIA